VALLKTTVQRFAKCPRRVLEWSDWIAHSLIGHGGRDRDHHDRRWQARVESICVTLKTRSGTGTNLASTGGGAERSGLGATDADEEQPASWPLSETTPASTRLP